MHRATRLFPVRQGDYDLALNTIRLLYGKRIAGRVSALAEIVKHTLTRWRHRP